jgi:integrase
LRHIPAISGTVGPAHSEHSLPLHTLGHVHCPACELARVRMIDPRALAEEKFGEAARIWLDGHRLSISPGTIRDYQQCIRTLSVFFRTLPLRDIHVGHFEQYQRMRSAGDGWPRPAGPSRVNHELNTLSQILSRANLWAPLAAHYKPMPLPRPNVGRALENHEAEKLFRFASLNPRWLVAYCCALISANSTADGSALRHLRLRNVHLDSGTIDIEEGEKNKYRIRSLPLNEPALWAAKQLVKRAREKGARDPEHYLLPHRAKNGGRGFDPTRPMFAWRGAWDQLREAAGMPTLRFKDLRHHAITCLLEDEGISERTVIDLAGHVSRAMLERYSHIRMRTKKEAVDALAKKSAAGVGHANLILVKR